MTTQEVDELLAELERQWFAEHAAATAARGEMRRAQLDRQIEAAEAARTELKRAEESKTAIIARIEALEESLLA